MSRSLQGLVVTHLLFPAVVRRRRGPGRELGPYEALSIMCFGPYKPKRQDFYFCAKAVSLAEHFLIEARKIRFLAWAYLLQSQTLCWLRYRGTSHVYIYHFQFPFLTPSSQTISSLLYNFHSTIVQTSQQIASRYFWIERINLSVRPLSIASPL
jgi:hypothetical protein